MDRIKELISKMTLEEKASLCSGADNWHTKEIKRLNIPSVMMVDGPHGLRKQEGAGTLSICRRIHIWQAGWHRHISAEYRVRAWGQALSTSC